MSGALKIVVLGANSFSGASFVDFALAQGAKSSSSVYGIKEEEQVTEDLELKPVSEYNKTKMVSERVLMSYMDHMKVQIIRPATVCGLSPRMRLDVSVNLLTMAALTKGEITVFGGRQIRPNVHIEDITDVYLHLHMVHAATSTRQRPGK